MLGQLYSSQREDAHVRVSSCACVSLSVYQAKRECSGAPNGARAAGGRGLPGQGQGCTIPVRSGA